MISYQDAVSEILENIEVLPAEEKPLLKSLGQVAAENIYSDLDLPQAASCIPDGYALRSADILAASRENPAILKIRETVRAGYLPRKKVMRGTASRVMTGSVLPRGADCVVRFEDTDEPPDKNGPNQNRPEEVKIFASATAGANVSKSGSLVQRKALVVAKGTAIGPVQISALISIGKTKIKVFRRPVIAIIATGDELIASGKPLGKGKSYNSNAAALAALIAHQGGVPKALGIARDNQASIRKKIARGLEADAIISSGGVSRGDFDLVRLVIGELGKVVFARLQMGPGRAVTFGLIDRKTNRGKQRSIPMFALSGPPAGCLINFETLVRPSLRKMMGHAITSHPEVEAVATESVFVRTPFPFVKWTQLEKTTAGYSVKFHSYAGSGMLPAMAMANSIAILPHGARINPGDKVRVLPLD